MFCRSSELLWYNLLCITLIIILLLYLDWGPYRRPSLLQSIVKKTVCTNYYYILLKNGWILKSVHFLNIFHCIFLNLMEKYLFWLTRRRVSWHFVASSKTHYKLFFESIKQLAGIHRVWICTWQFRTHFKIYRSWKFNVIVFRTMKVQDGTQIIYSFV